MAEANQDIINVSFLTNAQLAGLNDPENYEVLKDWPYASIPDSHSLGTTNYVLQNKKTKRIYMLATGVDDKGVVRRYVRDITPQVAPADAIPQPTGEAMRAAMEDLAMKTLGGADFDWKKNRFKTADEEVVDATPEVLKDVHGLMRMAMMSALAPPPPPPPPTKAMRRAEQKLINRDERIGACYQLRSAVFTFIASGVFVLKSTFRVVKAYVTNSKAPRPTPKWGA
jgi:hypothetical protein